MGGGGFGGGGERSWARTERACPSSVAVPAFPTRSASRRNSRSPASTYSAVQVRRARAAVPDAEFVQADHRTRAHPASFDAVVWTHAFNHVPRELLAPTFARIHGWLVEGGLLMTALGVGDTESWTGEWLGAPTFFSSFPRETNTLRVQEAGFEILRDELVTSASPKATRAVSGRARSGEWDEPRSGRFEGRERVAAAGELELLADAAVTSAVIGPMRTRTRLPTCDDRADLARERGSSRSRCVLDAADRDLPRVDDDADVAFGRRRSSRRARRSRARLRSGRRRRAARCLGAGSRR